MDDAANDGEVPAEDDGSLCPAARGDPVEEPSPEEEPGDDVASDDDCAGEPLGVPSPILALVVVWGFREMGGEIRGRADADAETGRGRGRASGREDDAARCCCA
jgi:hypothetical protein